MTKVLHGVLSATCHVSRTSSRKKIRLVHEGTHGANPLTASGKTKRDLCVDAAVLRKAEVH
jgi:hypothetical protein